MPILRVEEMGLGLCGDSREKLLADLVSQADVAVSIHSQRRAALVGPPSMIHHHLQGLVKDRRKGLGLLQYPLQLQGTVEVAGGLIRKGLATVIP